MTISPLAEMARKGMVRRAGDIGSLDEALLVAVPGQVTGLVGPPGFGLTRLGLVMIAAAAAPGPVAYVDVRGWMSPTAAWEAGISPEHLVVVRCDDPVIWARVVSGLLDGMHAVFAEVPRRVRDSHLRTMAAAVRTRHVPLLLRPVEGSLPAGVTQLQLEARRVTWEGTDRGHGRLTGRRVVLEASGKATRGMTRIIEVEDNGEDAVRLVSGLGLAPSGYAAG